MANPIKDHWNVIKCIFRYLASTIDYGLLYDQKTASKKVAGYVDSDHAGDLDKRRSMTCYAFSFGGGLISWKSVLQSTVALSTIEAEYMATTNAAKEAIWLKGLVEELGFKQDAI